ncbi:hypothetical protein MTR67_023580 [Solanum verrucosum]|uniref:RNase H type-1 domain-containing protein n=1 Tax=Solanum verrucosum TaxID=315347 RepID=A0AAF0R011_SOLVR|nr:hypothetical protein MTR67_023580 [Solanum verrucosum]
MKSHIFSDPVTGGSEGIGVKRKMTFCFVNELARNLVISSQGMHNKFERLFPPQGEYNDSIYKAQMINLRTPPFHMETMGVQDSAVWKLTESGNFTCTSAWEICRKKKSTAGWDEVDHILIQGHFAANTWKYFASNMGISLQQNTLSNYLMCSVKYGGKKSSILKVKYLILKEMILLLTSVSPYFQWPVIWPAVVDYIDKCKQEIRVNIVMWKYPPPNIYKLNTDGSASHNPGKIGRGGILRDAQGVIIYAFVVPLGEGTNNQAEVQATCYGLNWCIQHGYTNVISEVDSELLTKWLLQCIHTYREANGATDLLAKHSHLQDIVQHYYTQLQLPHAIKGSYLLEKMGVQNFRRKKLKRIKKPP